MTDIYTHTHTFEWAYVGSCFRLTYSFLLGNTALNNSLKEEIQHLKVLTGQAAPNGQAPMHIPTPYGANQQYHTNNHAAQPLHYQFRQHQLDQFQPCQLLLH